jgi:hypothetical protein
MKSTKPGCFKSFSWYLWKVFNEEGSMGLWFHDVWTCGAKVLIDF